VRNGIIDMASPELVAHLLVIKPSKSLKEEDCKSLREAIV
jgi:hypothetical protein